MRKNIFVLIITIFVLVGCKLEDSVSTPEPSPGIISKIGEYRTDVSEPSGLTLGANNSTLWTVSDNTNHVYQLSLNGTILKELFFEGNDLEGITFDKRDGTLWIAEEQLRQIVHIDTNGNELGRFTVTGLEGSGNSGLEGICLDTTFTTFVLNEKSPRLWAKLDNNYAAQTIKEITEVDDLSGIYFDRKRNAFWIVSDQSQLFFLWDEENGVTQKAELEYQKAEGVAVDTDREIVYIVSDATWKLYVYSLEL
jgi:uncharacterized protein YjiK